jgi:hypothetical protein
MDILEKVDFYFYGFEWTYLPFLRAAISMVLSELSNLNLWKLLLLAFY